MMFMECSIGVGTSNFGEMKWRCLTLAKGWLCKSELLSKHHVRKIMELPFVKVKHLNYLTRSSF